MAENQAPSGAGLVTSGGTTRPTSCIIARNKTAASTYDSDVATTAGAIASGGGNIIGAASVTAFTAQLDLVNVSNPGLDALAADGTHHLQSDSPAVDHGLCAVAGTTYTTDQLGQPRPGGGGAFCDSGAYELQVLPVGCVVKSGAVIRCPGPTPASSSR